MIWFLNIFYGWFNLQLQRKPTPEEKASSNAVVARNFLRDISIWRKKFGVVPESFYRWMDEAGIFYPGIKRGYSHVQFGNERSSSREASDFIRDLQLEGDPWGHLPDISLPEILSNPDGIADVNRLYTHVLEYKTSHHEQR